MEGTFLVQFNPQLTSDRSNEDVGVANFVCVSVHLRETGSLRREGERESGNEVGGNHKSGGRPVSYFHDISFCCYAICRRWKVDITIRFIANEHVEIPLNIKTIS